MRATVLLSILLSLAACAPDATQLVVVVDTNIAVPAQMSGVEVLVQGAEYSPPGKQSFQLTAADELPFSFGVAGGSDPSLPLTIDVSAINGAIVMQTRRATVRLVEGKTVVLPMYLHSDCVADVGQMCELGQTCVEGACQPDTVDVGTLKTIESGGQEF